MERFLILAVFCLLQLVSSQGHCPQGWTRWRDEKCYSIHASFLSYEASQQVCVTKGGLLATIKEEAQQTFLNHFIHNVSGIEDEVWLGATRLSKTDFQWEDGTPLEYANWAVESPSEVDGRDCVVMQSRISKLADIEGKWRDVSCTRPNLFVCEIEAVWSPEEVRKVLVETRKKLDNLAEEHERLADHHEDLVAKHENLERNPVPVGFIYTQLPGQPVPSILWPNVSWTEISSQFAGNFFRVVGGGAAAFGTMQGADSPRLTGGKMAAYNSGYVREVSIRAGSWSPSLYVGEGGATGKKDHISFYVSNPEIRPINTAVRIWTRRS